MVSGELVRFWKWAKSEREGLVEAVKQLLERGDISKLAPYLTGPRRDSFDCMALGEALRGAVFYETLRWLWSPRGLDPHTKYRLLLEVLCRSQAPTLEELAKILEASEESLGL